MTILMMLSLLIIMVVLRIFHLTSSRVCQQMTLKWIKYWIKQVVKRETLFVYDPDLQREFLKRNHTQLA